MIICLKGKVISRATETSNFSTFILFHSSLFRLNEKISGKIKITSCEKINFLSIEKFPWFSLSLYHAFQSVSWLCSFHFNIFIFSLIKNSINKNWEKFFLIKSSFNFQLKFVLSLGDIGKLIIENQFLRWCLGLGFLWGFFWEIFGIAWGGF